MCSSLQADITDGTSRSTPGSAVGVGFLVHSPHIYVCVRGHVLGCVVLISHKPSCYNHVRNSRLHCVAYCCFLSGDPAQATPPSTRQHVTCVSSACHLPRCDSASISPVGYRHATYLCLPGTYHHSVNHKTGTSVSKFKHIQMSTVLIHL